eukprot:scaffold1655_cov247-Pinguiococcus_pyrenoidosus.AAC.11
MGQLPEEAHIALRRLFFSLAWRLASLTALPELMKAEVREPREHALEVVELARGVCALRRSWTPFAGFLGPVLTAGERTVELLDGALNIVKQGAQSVKQSFQHLLWLLPSERLRGVGQRCRRRIVCVAVVQELVVAEGQGMCDGARIWYQVAHQAKQLGQAVLGQEAAVALVLPIHQRLHDLEDERDPAEPGRDLHFFRQSVVGSVALGRGERSQLHLQGFDPGRSSLEDSHESRHTVHVQFADAPHKILERGANLVRDVRGHIAYTGPRSLLEEQIEIRIKRLRLLHLLGVAAWQCEHVEQARNAADDVHTGLQAALSQRIQEGTGQAGIVRKGDTAWIIVERLRDHGNGSTDDEASEVLAVLEDLEEAIRHACVPQEVRAGGWRRPLKLLHGSENGDDGVDQDQVGVRPLGRGPVRARGHLPCAQARIHFKLKAIRERDRAVQIAEDRRRPVVGQDRVLDRVDHLHEHESGLGERQRPDGTSRVLHQGEQAAKNAGVVHRAGPRAVARDVEQQGEQRFQVLILPGALIHAGVGRPNGLHEAQPNTHIEGLRVRAACQILGTRRAVVSGSRGCGEGRDALPNEAGQEPREVAPGNPELLQDVHVPHG